MSDHITRQDNREVPWRKVMNPIIWHSKNPMYNGPLFTNYNCHVLYTPPTTFSYSFVFYKDLTCLNQIFIRKCSTLSHESWSKFWFHYLLKDKVPKQKHASLFCLWQRTRHESLNIGMSSLVYIPI